MQLAHGSRDIPTVEKALLHLLPRGSDANFSVTAITETKVERAIKPESIALGVFGAIAALAALAIAALAISRQLRSADEDLSVLRALGAGPAMTVGDGLIGILSAIVVGSIFGGGGRGRALTAVAARTRPDRLPPWRDAGRGRLDGPGPRGARDPHWRAQCDRRWTGLTEVLPTVWPLDPARYQSGDSRLLQMATASGLSAPAAVGDRFALKPGGDRTSVPADACWWAPPWP